jgi:hypothetical protein
MQDPTPQCCCTQANRQTVRKKYRIQSKTTRWGLTTYSAGLLSHVSGDLQTRHLARLSLVRGDLQTCHTAPHSVLVPRIADKVARRGALPPMNRINPLNHHCGLKSSCCFPPRTKPPPWSQKTEDVTRTVF